MIEDSSTAQALALLMKRLKDCLTKHRACNRPRRTLLEEKQTSGNTTHESSHLYPTGLRLIDVRSLEIVSPPPECRYVALSYVWEECKVDAEPKLAPSFPRLELSNLPKTISDAIKICAYLGERYLWVDALCICQNDVTDMILQIAQMDKIYDRAIATIIVATETNPSEGVSLSGLSFVGSQSPLQDILDRALWTSRGWTYQEFVLSRRLLIFTSKGVYFHCAEDSTHRIESWELPSLGNGTCWTIYNQSLRTYTTRHLSRKTDTLNAISGIQRVFARYTDDVFVGGLPARQLFYALLWHPVASAERQPMWPSWSWAGWTGPGQKLCAVINPASEAVSRQWGDSSARWGSTGRIFHSCLDSLRFCPENGQEMLIPLYPEDESLKQYLNTGTSGGRPGLSPDRLFHDRGYLRFKSHTVNMSIVLETEYPLVSERYPLLRRYRLKQDEVWVGTIFLNPDNNGNYPETGESCDFVVLTKFKAYNHSIHSEYLDGLLHTSEAKQEPLVFPRHHWERARFEVDFEWGAWQRGEYHSKIGYKQGRNNFGDWETRGHEDPHYGMPYPPEVECSQVMWIDRKDDVIYRKAIGIATGFRYDAEPVEFCLG